MRLAREPSTMFVSSSVSPDASERSTLPASRNAMHAFGDRYTVNSTWPASGSTCTSAPYASPEPRMLYHR